LCTRKQQLELVKNNLFSPQTETIIGNNTLSESAVKLLSAEIDSITSTISQLKAEYDFQEPLPPISAEPSAIITGHDANSVNDVSKDREEGRDGDDHDIATFAVEPRVLVTEYKNKETSEEFGEDDDKDPSTKLTPADSESLAQGESDNGSDNIITQLHVQEEARKEAQRQADVEAQRGVIQSRIDALAVQMDLAAEAEDYESAAVIEEQIQALRATLK
jgi:hypothetical protein